MVLRSDDHTMVLGTPPKARTAMYLMAAMMVVVGAAVAIGVFVDPSARPAALLVILFGVPFALAFAFYFYSLAGPCELSLDLDQRRYELVRGFPGRPHRYTGGFEDFHALTIQGGYRSPYCVMLEWDWRLSRADFPLGGASRRDDAHRMRDELASKLGIAGPAVEARRAG